MKNVRKEYFDNIDGKKFLRTQLVVCPICSQDREPREIQARFGLKAMVAECEDCRIAFQTPRPSIEASIAYMNMRWNSEDTYVANVESQVKRATAQLSYVSQNHKGSLNLVDFGAGAGSFVKAAIDNGWEAYGIEHSDSAIARAKDFYGVNLYKEFQGEKVDVVTMWDVIEHLQDPQDTLEMVAKTLKEDGLLVVETGNYEHWRRLVERDSWGLYLFDHHYYFTPESLKKVLLRSGFENVRLLDVDHRAPVITLRKCIGHPISTAVSWFEYKRAMAKWPSHGDIYNMVLVAQKSSA